MRQAVFELFKVEERHGLGGFSLVDRSSILGNRDIYADFWPASSEWEWEAPRLARRWTPRKVAGDISPNNDYAELAAQIPCFSQRAVEAIGEVLHANGELLPLYHQLGPYWAFNCTTVVEALDHDKSTIEWADHVGYAMGVERYVFDAALLAGATIFRPREVPNRVLVTSEFLARAKAAKLCGLRFLKLWPLPEGLTNRRARSEELI